jgi:flagellar basal-body rod protein FlgB
MMRSIDMLERGMDAAMVRRNVVANNIANVDVPHFKRSEVAFEAELKRALDSERVVEETPRLLTLHKEHISGPAPRDYRSVRPQIKTDYATSMRNDGNNVDIEDEITQMNRNQMQYNLIADRLGSNFRLLNSLIRLS